MAVQVALNVVSAAGTRFGSVGFQPLKVYPLLVGFEIVGKVSSGLSTTCEILFPPLVLKVRVTWLTTTTGVDSSTISPTNIFKLDEALYLPFTKTLIITTPAFLGVTNPLLSTEAINELELVHRVSKI